MSRDVARAPAGWVLVVAGAAGTAGAFGPWASLDLAYLPGATLAGKYAVPSSLAAVVVGVLVIVGFGRAWLCGLAMAAGAVGVGVGVAGFAQVHDVAPSLSPDWGLVLTVVAGGVELVAGVVAVTTRRPRTDALRRPIPVAPAATTTRLTDAVGPPTRDGRPIAEPWVGRVLAITGVIGALSTAAPWRTSFLDQLRAAGYDTFDGIAAAILMLGIAASGVSIAIRNRSIAAPIVALCCAALCLLLTFDLYSAIEKLFLRIAIDSDFSEVGWGLLVCAAAAVVAAAASVRALARRGPEIVT